jgi:glycosyltransferase involved in cell wall biosynthesis
LKISIITVTYNASAVVADCIASVQGQSFPEVEHIIIDGGSKDGTQEIARESSQALRIISEPDKGIYDAMNKGICLSTGEIVGILNADDFYASMDVLAKVAEVFTDSKVDACYGDLQYVDRGNIKNIRRTWRSGAYSAHKFWWGWMPPHPTFFVRKSIYRRFGLFDLDLGSAADYELMLRFLARHNIQAVYIPQVLVTMRAGGVSNSSLLNRLRANRMDRKAWVINGLKPYPWTLSFKPLRKIGQWLLK